MNPHMNKRLTRPVFILFILLAWLVLGLTGGATASTPADLAAASYLSDTVNESSPLTCPDSMLGYWKLDEVDGTTFTDYFAGNDGACTDKCPTPAEGIVQGAQSFDHDEISVPYDAAFNWTAGDSFSIELWVNSAEGLGAGLGIFISRHAGSPAWWVGYDQEWGRAAFALRDSSRIGIEVWGETAVNDGDWHHLVAVHDADKDEIQLYVDGALDKSAPVTFTGNWISERYIGIGFHNDSTDNVPKYHYTGKLDEIAIYGKALSLDEVQYHYNQGLQGEGYCETVDLTILINGAGSVEEYPVKPYKYGQEVTLTAVPEPGFIFYDWSGDLAGYDNPVTIRMDKDKVITASFSEPVWYTLAVATMGEGTVPVEPELEEYLHGSRVTLTAVPQPGWLFTGWSGDLAGDDNPVDVVMTADKNVIATFSVPKIFLPLSLK
jgi:hypothetical protein